MIYLQTDTVNTVILTLQEKVTLDAPVYFLFEFTNDDTNVSTLFTGADISTNITRYNEFLIEVTEDVTDLEDSVINLAPNGYWKYTIYEQESPTNLDIVNTTSIVETGKVYLKGAVVPEKSEYTPDSDTVYVYQG